MDIKLAQLDDPLDSEEQKRILAGLKNAKEKELLFELDEAEELLKDVLAKGTIKSKGRVSLKEAFEQIPTVEWTRLNICYERGEAPWAVDERAFNKASETYPKRSIWIDVKFESEGILFIWPKPAPNPDTAKSKESAEARDQKILAATRDVAARRRDEGKSWQKKEIAYEIHKAGMFPDIDQGTIERGFVLKEVKSFLDFENPPEID